MNFWLIAAVVGVAGVVGWGWLIREIVTPHGTFGRCTCRKGARCLSCMERDEKKPRGKAANE